MAEVMTLENGRTKLRHRNDVENSSGHSRFYFIQEATHAMLSADELADPEGS